MDILVLQRTALVDSGNLFHSKWYFLLKAFNSK